MTHDALFGSILILAAVALFAVLVVAGAGKLERDRTRLPGALGRDDTWPALDEWEAHVASTPGLEAEADRAIEACDLELWELEHDWPEVYEAEDFGDAG